MPGMWVTAGRALHRGVRHELVESRRTVIDFGLALTDGFEFARGQHAASEGVLVERAPEDGLVYPLELGDRRRTVIDFGLALTDGFEFARGQHAASEGVLVERAPEDGLVYPLELGD